MDDPVLLRAAPGAITGPRELTDEILSTALSMPGPGVVATVEGWQSLCAGDESVDEHDWWVVGTIARGTPSRVVFDGLTFPATVYVDDDPVAVVESMFLPVTVALSPGEHVVAIHFGSLTAWLRTRRPRGRWRSSLVSVQGLRWARTTLLGRAPLYAGNPAPVGFWRPMRVIDGLGVEDLVVVADATASTVRITGRVVDGGGDPTGAIDVAANLADTSGTSVVNGAVSSAADGTFALTLAVDDPELWWPNGHGRQSLYRLAVSAGDHRVDRTVGFRTVGIDRSDDGVTLRVNGIRIFCRGAVWVPADPVALQADPAAIRRRLEFLAAAGATMVRVPGGLVYEQNDFWDLCAELGLLVWQDAMVVTFDPPTDLDDVTVRELQTVLRAVGGNPSIAVVSGGSETIQQPVLLGLPAEDRGMDLIETRLAAVAADADVPYVMSSPSAPADSGQFPLRADTGVSHWFGVGGYQRPLTDVVSADVRFAAEVLAFSIPPRPAAVERHFTSAAVAGHQPAWKAGVPRDRGAGWDFEDVRDHYVAQLFDVDPAAVRRRDPERYLRLGRVAVAEAMYRCFIHWRTDSRCGGALVLCAADLVPGAGWGLLDVDGDPKLPLAMLARAWSPIALLLTDAGLDGVRVDVVNDGPDAIDAEVRLVATGDGGGIVAHGSTRVYVAAHGASSLLDTEITGVFRDLSDAYRFGPRAASGVEATLHIGDVQRARDVLVIGDGPRPPIPGGPRCVATRRPDESGWDLELLSEVAVRWLEIDCPGWEPDDNVFHLAAGRPHRVALRPRGHQRPAGDPARGPHGWVRTPDHAAGTAVEVIG